jgi:hypothetical protein
LETNSTLPTCGVSFSMMLRTRSTSRFVTFDFMKTSAMIFERTSFAAPVVACTIGMKTPSSRTVTSTVASAANDGTALRLSARSASRKKNPRLTRRPTGAR